MKKIGRAFGRLWAKTRALVRRGGAGGAPKKDVGARVREQGALWQLATFATAIIVAVAAAAGLTLCDFGAIHGMTPFGPSCARGSQIAGNLSVGAGVGFLVFLIMEVSGMVFAELFRQRREDAAERREQIAELSHRLELAEMSRREDAAERRAEAAEQRSEISKLAHRLEVSEQSRNAEITELSLRLELAEQARRAEAERAARLELELEIAKRNAAQNGDGESG